MPAVTVFTGFLGAGKTTLILQLLPRLKERVVVLKNEFGDAKVDSALVRQQHVQVQEMVNGCLCCVLVGQLSNALEEICSKYNPDRIIIETSGSAFPGPIAWQIRSMPQFRLDAILTVVDCLNFRGYEDVSYTAKLQATYSDLILLNKWDLISDRALDDVIDRVNDLNDETPKFKVNASGSGLPVELVFGPSSVAMPKELLSSHEIDHSAEIEFKRCEIPFHHARIPSLAQLSKEIESCPT